MFDTVLVANRGEVAVRIIRTLRALGVRSVAVHSDADADARHVAEADTAVRLGPAAASTSYLSAERILDAAEATGAQAVHPGYGFLAENAAFAAACTKAGLVFVGPPAEVIETVGDKIRAKQTVAAAGVPVVPGRAEPGLSDDDLAAAAAEIGFPVLLKPSAGGGGKGMRLVHDAQTFAAQVAGARREARAAFVDDALLVERLVPAPRHVEVQVLADGHGDVLHLGERECSLQRRHQKIIEEAPAPLLGSIPDGPAIRARLGAAAVAVARAVGYTGAGTVEFITSDRGEAGAAAPEFFFLEMNTRLQVEHPVTELVTGLDLVEWQLRIAAGQRLAFGQDDVRMDGHAAEARVYAEDPARGFLPTGGIVLALHEPSGPNVRVDSGLRVGTVVGSDYDPLLAKVIAWAPDRDTALRRLDAALAETAVLGVVTNTAFLRALLADPDVRAGRLDTGLVERRDPRPAEVGEEVLAAAALDRMLDLEPIGPADPWELPSGWRLGEPAWTTLRIEAVGRESAEVRVRGRAGAAAVSVDGGEPVPASARRYGELLAVSYRGHTRRYRRAWHGEVSWLGRDGHAWALREQHQLAGARTDHTGPGGPLTSPMPGTVLAVHVAAGDTVAAGTPLVVVEAMKMEHAVTAPFDGLVSAVHVRPGDQVGMDQPLAELTPQA